MIYNFKKKNEKKKNLFSKAFGIAQTFAECGEKSKQESIESGVTMFGVL